jgi:hypothetical protein
LRQHGTIVLVRVEVLMKLWIGYECIPTELVVEPAYPFYRQQLGFLSHDFALLSQGRAVEPENDRNWNHNRSDAT